MSAHVGSEAHILVPTAVSKGAVPVALLNIRTVPEEGGQVVLPATSEKT